MSVEAKVGAFTMGGLLLLLSSVFALGDFHLGGDRGYTVYAGFRQVIGLEPQSAVCLSGVPIGKVQSVANDGGGVAVTMQIQPDVRIPRHSNVMVASSGVMGEKFVNILPGKDMGDYLQDGDYVFGADEVGMDAMFEGMNKALLEAQELLASMNSVIGDPTFKQNILDMSTSMREASSHMETTMASLERMALGSEDSIQQAVQELPVILGSMERTMDSVEHMMANIDSVAGDPAVAENLRVTLQNVATTSEKVAHMAENMDGVLGDPKTAEDAKAILGNARSLTERADKMLGKVADIRVKPGVDVLYSGGRDDWNANFDLEVGAPDSPYLVLGVEDIGEDNHVNAQVGKRFGNFGARAGAVAGKAGVGLDAYVGDRWKFSAEAYDLKHSDIRLRAQYRIAGDTHLVGQWKDIRDRDHRAAYVGIRQEF